ncbi:uncharacterized protein LOC129950496 [Eupeodes corollae]|uniref:uncharacterized protein LOC129950496 n=1 Tax=Eupeodes corollae TaxID=290404 RepID=UPI00249108CB|nr:uncharacterized protein LOC129950496 [Eupeodes corollae]
MKLITVTFVTLVLTIGISEQYFHSPAVELIKKVHEESFAEAICFVCVDGAFLNLFLKVHSNIPVVIFDSHSPNISSNASKSLYGHVMIVVEAVREDPNDIEVLHELILRLGVRNFAAIIAEDIDRLRRYFSFLWEKKFRRTFGIVNGTFYAYFPYADSTVLRFTNLNPLPNAQMNLNGHVIRTAIKLDLPRSFWYTDNHGVRKVGGFVAQVLTHFLEKYNGTFVDALKNNFEKMKEIDAVVKGNMDVTMNPYIPSEGIQLSYPVKLSRWTIIVPLRGFLDPNEYFLRPFSPTLWICIGLTCLYIILMHMLMNILLGLPPNIWHSFSQMYLTMLNMSLDQEYFRAYRFQFIQKIFAFIIVNFYLVFLTSFLTVYIKVKEYDSIEELIDDGFPVMMAEYDWNFTDHKIFPKGFEKILLIVPADELVKTRYSVQNTTYAYGGGIDASNFLQSVVARYSRPKFKWISASLNQALYAFIWAQNAPLQEVLGQFIIRISDYGLIIKWTQDAVMQGSQIVKKYMKIKPESSDILFPLTVKQLRFAWTCLLSGLTVASAVFLGEKFGVNLWKSFSFNSNRNPKM